MTVALHATRLQERHELVADPLLPPEHPAGAVTPDLADVDADRFAENLEPALGSLGVEDPEPGRVEPPFAG